jgi:glutathione S-transferase
LGVEYEIVAYGRDRKTMLAPPELTEIHPLGKSPVIGPTGLPARHRARRRCLEVVS